MGATCALKCSGLPGATQVTSEAALSCTRGCFESHIVLGIELGLAAGKALALTLSNSLWKLYLIFFVSAYLVMLRDHTGSIFKDLAYWY